MAKRPHVIMQPGPPLDPRVVAVEARGRVVSIDLRAGDLLLSGLRRGFEKAGLNGGVASFGNLALGPFAYVMPALSKTGENAAFYSDTYRPAGMSRVEAGAITVGERDGQPFFHCHAIWTEEGGKRTGGHILPDETFVAEDVRIEALGIDGAMFVAEPDPETNFKLFGPRATPSSDVTADRRVITLRLKPNQDFLTTLEDLTSLHKFKRAAVRGGVGSIIGAAFADGSIVENFATEVFIVGGSITRRQDGTPHAAVEAALVDYTGQLAAGSLIKGENPVLMTFELALEILE